uniref:Proteasome subunit beta n=1 Tax=Timema monikensis TaxID=170555 RepID=A0A7R9HRR1_9NEOP|nr:unnamed protein product [Timema monikensis]
MVEGGRGAGETKSLRRFTASQKKEQSAIRPVQKMDNVTQLTKNKALNTLHLVSGSNSPLNYNGGAVVAMQGHQCVAIASDKRLGVQSQTVSTDFQKLFPMGPRMYLGLTGLATDIKTCHDRLKFRLNLYNLREGRDMHPKTFASMVSNMLYEKRFGSYYLVEPVVAGLDPLTFKPYVVNMDIIGCLSEPGSFVVAGTCSRQLYGLCEALWEPDLEPDDLFERISQALVNSCDRDAISGCGVVVHLM